MAVIGGIILWLVLIGLVVGYFIVKKVGDKREPHMKSFLDEKRLSSASDEDDEKKSPGVNDLSSWS